MVDSFYDIADSFFNTDNIVKIVCEELEKKYKEKFVVKKIGNRYGMNNFENATLYCTLEKNERFVFKVEFDMVNEIILEDDYYLRLVCFELEDFLNKEFIKNEVVSINSLEVLKVNKLEENISIKNFINKYSSAVFLDTIIVKDDVSDEKIKKVFNRMLENFKDIKIKVLVYCLNSDDFYSCKKEINAMPFITLTEINKFEIKDIKKISILNNNMTIN